MSGRFGTVKVKRSELLPPGELSVALGFSDPDDLLVALVDEDVDDPPGAPPEPRDRLDDLDGQAPRPAISSRGIQAAPDHESDAHPQPVYTPTRASAPATAEEIDLARVSHRQREMTEAERLGIPRLAERGVTFGELAWVARALGVEATLLPGAAVRLKGVWGLGEYGSLAAAAAALNARSFHP